jgi:hypothetical protein
MQTARPKQGSAAPGTERHLYAVTIIVAVGVWLVPWLFLGRKEAWDHWSYFSVSVPLMALVAAYAGYRAHSRPWRWPLTLIAAQFLTALLLGGFGNLLPVGMLVLVILGVPMMITAWIGAWLGKRRRLKEAQGG